MTGQASYAQEGLAKFGADDDFDDYWKFHLNNERHRVDRTRYAET